MRLARLVLVLVLALAALAGPAGATSHTWRITEVFSDPTGQIQFVELTESIGDAGETHMNEVGMFLKTIQKIWYLPRDLVGDTSHAHVLVATPAFAALDGAPAPDYVLEPGFVPLFDPRFDALTFGNELNTFSFKLLPVETLPTDGVHALHWDVEGNGPEIAPRTPTNFAGDTWASGVATETISVGEAKRRIDKDR